MAGVKPAGFWKRLLSRCIDFLLTGTMSMGLLFILKGNRNSVSFSKPWMFYFWSICTILFIFIFMIMMPILTKGSSIGMCLVKIKVISLKNNIYKAILKRELFFAFAWIFVALITMLLVNHTLIYKIKRYTYIINKQQANLTIWENTRISICGSISGLVSFVQMFVAITIIPDDKKMGWHDKYAESQVIYAKQTIQTKNDKTVEIIKPAIIKQEKVEWI